MRESKVNTDEVIINEILERSISAVYPSKDELKKVLTSGKRLKIYIGADATGPDLHIGHSTNYILLEKFRKLGHEVIVLFGDFTAMIGDPTGKDSARIALSKNQVENNIKTWKKQLKPLLNFSSWFGGPKIVKNSEWLSKLNFEDVVKLSSEFTVSQMIERDMFSNRVKEQKPIFLNEFLYPLMQGYDSVALDVDIEIGGTDQTFNMLAGRTLLKKYKNKEKFVITTTLLENPKTGKKLMSKSEGGYISLQDSPKDMFGKTMALPDEAIRSVFIDCTLITTEEINSIFEKNTNPKDLKTRLGYELVKMYHGQKKAEEASKYFDSTFSKKEIPDNILELSFDGLLVDALISQKIISSKSEFSRLIKEGAVMKLDDSKKIEDMKFVAEEGTYKIGKHRFVKIKK